MDYTWYKVNGETIPNLAEYVREHITKFEGEYEIFVGTDSQRLRKKSTVLFAIVVCIYRVGKGAHIIYAKYSRTDPMLRDKYHRLRAEVNCSLNVADYLRSSGILYDEDILQIHIDLSPKAENLSNKIYAEALGWVRGCGFLCEGKPDAPAASYAGDWIVKNKTISYAQPNLPAKSSLL